MVFSTAKVCSLDAYVRNKKYERFMDGRLRVSVSGTYLRAVEVGDA